jgi:hypothetical protein
VTKPAAPQTSKDAARAPGPAPEQVVEIDAIDVGEWERDQHTTEAPVAGLAALIRQTAPQQARVEPRPKRHAATQPIRVDQAAARTAPANRRGQPPNPPASPVAPAAESPSFEAVTAPAMLSLAALAARRDEAAAASKHLAPGVVRLPLTAPPSGPITNPALMMPRPVVVESEHRLRAAPDHTPAPPAPIPPAPPALDAFEPPARTDSPDVPALRPSLASRRVIAIAGATIAVVIAVIFVAATRGSAPSDHRSKPAATAPARVTPTAAHAVVVERPPAPAPAPSAQPLPPPPPPSAAADPSAASPAPERATARTTLALRDEPLVVAKPHRPRPTPAYRGNRKPSRAVAQRPVAHEESEPVEDEPSIARARVAYDAGNQALFSGDSAAAIRAYRQVLGYAPTYAAGFRGLGLAHAQEGDIGAAVMALRTYLSLAPRARDVALIKKRIAILQAASADRSAQRRDAP